MAFFRRSTRSGDGEKPRRQAPEGSRIYAIGDIHGRADLLAELHEKIRQDAAAHPAGRLVLIYIGDYVDRGLHSREVIDLLLEPPLEGFERFFLRGNHEALMLDFLGDATVGAGWLEVGGNATLYSYGVGLKEGSKLAERLQGAQEQIREKLPPAHLEFLNALLLSHTEGDFFFVHAGVRPNLPLEKQTERDLLWIRDEFLHSRSDHGKIVVHGHSISWEPEILPNRIGIDTGAFASGVLTAVVLAGSTVELLKTGN